MDRWDRSPQDRRAEEQDSPQRASGSQRRVHEPHRWRREDRPTTPSEWEVQEFYESFDTPRP
ncbi:MAG TPA: hypothetical protein VD997_08185 [Phycisphaerales bacterium]|nr:hypothetical protein [Phycisphaerales bacterium]